MDEILLLGFHIKATRAVSDTTPGDTGGEKPLVTKQSFLRVSDGDNRDHQAEMTDEKMAYLIAFVSSELVTKSKDRRCTETAARNVNYLFLSFVNC